MSATYKMFKSKSGRLHCGQEYGKSSSSLTASELRQLCQTMGEPYAHLIAELEKNNVVELLVAYSKVQIFTSG